MFLVPQKAFVDPLRPLRSPWLQALVLVLLALTSSTAAFASPSPQPSDELARTGEDDGFSTQLQQLGVTYSGEYVGELSSVVDGGLTRASSGRHLFTFDVEFDLLPILGVKGATLFAQFLSVSSESGGTADSGDIQTYSNIENDRALSVIYEAWYQQRLLDNRVRIKIGKVDANSDFAVLETAADFANSSAGFTPAVVGFPSYPDPGMSFSVFLETIVRRSINVTVGYGYYDGAGAVDEVRIGSRGPSTFFKDEKSDDYFHIAEAGIAWEQLGSLQDGRLALGGWRHTGDFQTVSNQVQRGTDGYYASLEQRVLSVDTPEVSKSLDLFLQYGSANQLVSEIKRQFGAGLVARGWLPGRRDDSLGFYLTVAGLSRAAGVSFGSDETALEIYYRSEFRRGFFLQPGVHYINDPSGDQTVKSARIVSFRAGLSF